MKKIIILALVLGLALPASAQVESDRKPLRPQAQAAGTTEQELQASRDAFRKSMEVQRAEMQRSMQAREEGLRAKLAVIKDERKKAAVGRIDRNLAELNARMTAHYVSVLDQIDRVLGRVVTRTDKAQTNGKDTASVRAAIGSAQVAIVEARAAVTAQGAKIYVLNVRTEANLRNDVSTARKTLHHDLKTAQDSVKAAREAVRRAAVALAQIPGVDDLKDASSTPTSTNQ